MKKATLIFLVIFAFANNLFSQIFPLNGLTARYTFNGNAIDSSGNGRHGTVHSALLTSDRFGNANSAYNFNGTSSYIEVTPPDTFMVSNYSISCWIKPNVIPGNGTYKYIISLGGINADNGMSLNNNTVQGIVGGSYNVSTAISLVNNNSQVNLNSWYHLTLTRNNNILSLYINGLLIDTAFTGSDANFGGAPKRFTIGARSTLASSFFINAKIDDIFMYNRVLSANEVIQVFNATPCNVQIVNQTTSKTVHSGLSAGFKVVSTGPTSSYNWQVDNGFGYNNIIDNCNYSGSSTDSLTIPIVALNMNGYNYRCIVSSSSCTDTSLLIKVIVDSTFVTVYDTTHVTLVDTTFISVADTLIINVLLSGVLPPHSSNLIKVYPNPTKNKIEINTGNFGSMNGYLIEVTNSLGQKVYTTSINSQLLSIDLNTWTGKGIYFIHIIDPQNHTIEIKKIILQ